MTLLDLWTAVQAGGAAFVLFLGTVLFFSGRLINGEVARQARQESEEALARAHDEQMTLMRERFAEMQSIWKDRYDELSERERYYRTFALTFAKQADAAFAVAEGVVKPGRFAPP